MLFKIFFDFDEISQNFSKQFHIRALSFHNLRI